MTFVTGLARVLVVDDEVSARTALADLLRDEGYDVEMAADAFKALGKCDTFSPHVVVTDLCMPGMTGQELMTKLAGRDDPIAVVMITAFPEVQSAVRAMREGAAGYLTKPIDLDELLVVIDRVRFGRFPMREARELRDRTARRRPFEGIVGTSLAMQRVFEVAAQVAASNAPIVVTGERGVGKERIARAIHERSERHRGPFVTLHCAALTEPTLAELLSSAAGGTAYFDEISAVRPAVQAALLEALDEQRSTRAGGLPTAGARIIAATRRDLCWEMARGRFRSDLYYRLHVVNLHIPALRDRKEDLPALVDELIRQHAPASGKPIDSCSTSALRVIGEYAWPGNLDELDHVIARAVVLATGRTVDCGHLPAVVMRGAVKSVPTIPGASLAELERYAIDETVKSTGGSVVRAAKILGLSIRTIQLRMSSYKRTSST